MPNANATPRAPSEPKSIDTMPVYLGLHDLIVDQAKTTPENLALTDESGSRLTYREMLHRSDAWVAKLLELQVQRGQRIGISLERSTDLVCAMVAVLRVGCAYVPLDPGYPKTWKEFVLRDSGISLMIGEDEFLATENPSDRVTYLHAKEVVPVEHIKIPDRFAVSEMDTAYLMYTSGSTGVSKGVLVQHSNSVNFIRWAQMAYSVEELSHVLAITSICFDLSIFEIFVPLSVGGTCCILKNALSLVDHEPETPLTLINTVPSVIAELVRLDAVPKSTPVINLGGEPLSGIVADALYRRFGASKVFNLYGPSETTTYSTSCLVPRGAAIPSIGRPILNTRIHLLDESRTPVPSGQIGELYISGAGVATGYLNRLELTAERFINIELEDRTVVRAYRTGDYASWRDNGDLEFQGRLDDQVKIRGFRVELTQVEECIRKCEGVSDAAVVANAVEGSGLRLVAYVVLNEIVEVSLEIVRRELAAKLPSYMVPTVWQRRTELPKMPNGKVNRKELRDQIETSNPSEFSSEEKSLVPFITQAMASVLHLPTVTSDDNFFAIGGDSLLAVALISRLREISDRAVPVSAVFEAPTPKELAALISVLEVKRSKYREARASADAAKLTEPQLQMLRLSMFADDAPINNVALRLELDARRSRADLFEAVERVRQKQLVLRSCASLDGMWVPCSNPFSVDVVDVSSMDDSELLNLCQDLAAVPIDPTAQAPWRVTLLDREEKPQCLVFVLHHLAVDERSIEILAEDLLTSLRTGLPTTFSSAIETESIDPGLAAQNMIWWKELFRDWPTVLLTTDKPYTLIPNFKSTRCELHLSLETHLRINEVSRAFKITRYELLMATLLKALHSWMGQTRLTIGSVFSTRSGGGEGQQSMGFHANLLPLNFNVNPESSWAELFQAISSTIRAAQQHKDVSAELLQTLAKSAKSGLGLLPVRFGAIRAFRAISPNSSYRFSELEIGFSEAPLNFQVRFDEAETTIYVDGHAELFYTETLKKLVTCWSEFTLEALSPQPLVLSTSAPLEQRRSIGSSVAAPSPSICGLLDEVIDTHGTRLAIREDSNQITYAGLREKIAAVSAILRSTAAVGDPVGIQCDSVVNSVASMVACLSCGCVFVPLNSRDPQTRIETILGVCGARLLLVDDEGPKSNLERKGIDCVNVADLPSQSNIPEAATLCRNAQATMGTAYILFTSGSTGVPKGVAQSERALVQHIQKYIQSIQLTAADQITLLASVGFDAALMDIFAALLTGSCLHPISLRGRGISEINAFLRGNEITVLHATPSVFRLAMSASSDSTPFSSIRYVVLGGEIARKTDLDLFKIKCVPGAFLINGYGPTESTLALQAAFDHASVCESSTLPIGTPVPGTEVVLIDQDGREQEIEGEMEIRSPYVLLGYVNSPEDFRSLKGTGEHRSHRTGDLARRLPDGRLLSLGRRDHQVKISGVRVELGEIESTLIAANGVKEACVVQCATPLGDNYLVGYVLPHGGCNLDTEQLFIHLRDRLPSAMIPARILSVPHFPYLLNGKVDRASLPSIEYVASPSRSLSAFESKIANIWNDALGTQIEIRPTDTFMTLGGKSLSALSVVASIEQRLQIRARPSSLLQNPTLEEFSKLLNDRVAEK